MNDINTISQQSIDREIDRNKNENIELNPNKIIIIQANNKKIDAKVAGCLLTKDDLPLIIASIACFASYIVYGACISLLGASLPSLAIRFKRTTSEFGIAFTVRGVGYLIGLSIYLTIYLYAILTILSNITIFLYRYYRISCYCRDR